MSRWSEFHAIYRSIKMDEEELKPLTPSQRDFYIKVIDIWFALPLHRTLMYYEDTLLPAFDILKAMHYGIQEH
jgi:hypothetical protein